jgi:hypothetical protein
MPELKDAKFLLSKPLNYEGRWLAFSIVLPFGELAHKARLDRVNYLILLARKNQMRWKKVLSP